MASFSASWKPSEKLVQFLQGIKKRRLGELATKSIKNIVDEEKDNAIAAVIDLVKPSEVSVNSAHAQLKYKRNETPTKAVKKVKSTRVPLSSLEKKIRYFRF